MTMMVVIRYAGGGTGLVRRPPQAESVLLYPPSHQLVRGFKISILTWSGGADHSDLGVHLIWGEKISSLKWEAQSQMLNWNLSLPYQKSLVWPLSPALDFAKDAETFGFRGWPNMAKIGLEGPFELRKNWMYKLWRFMASTNWQFEIAIWNCSIRFFSEAALENLAKW